jgi:hypothetical protein
VVIRPLALLAFLALVSAARSQLLSPVADVPNWAEIDALQETVTRAEFVRLLEEVYAPNRAAQGLVEVAEDHALVLKRFGQPNDPLTLRFARTASSARKTPRFWRTRAERGRPPADRPLNGMRIALDPGHLGGGWARMEARWFKIGDTPPVTEGDLTLVVGEHLARKLSTWGADVQWVRRTPTPATHRRPADFFPQARTLLAAQGNPEPRVTYGNFNEPGRGETLQFQAELLFYRMDEIRHRARLVNNVLKPDLVVCLHFNAEAWGRDSEPQLASRNHFHVLVNGAYSASELRLDDNRFEMLLRLLGGVTREEHRISTTVARVVARQAALPPFTYTRTIARRVNESPYVWARNLLANRLYRCPVVFLEPYVMNSQEVWERVQAGDYEGERVVAGSLRKSIFREYADAVADGLAAGLGGE